MHQTLSIYMSVCERVCSCKDACQYQPPTHVRVCHRNPLQAGSHLTASTDNKGDISILSINGDSAGDLAALSDGVSQIFPSPPKRVEGTTAAIVLVYWQALSLCVANHLLLTLLPPTHPPGLG